MADYKDVPWKDCVVISSSDHTDSLSIWAQTLQIETVLFNCTLRCNRSHNFPQREVCGAVAGLWWHAGRQRQPVALILTRFGSVMAVTSPKSPRWCDPTMTGLTSVWLLFPLAGWLTDWLTARPLTETKALVSCQSIQNFYSQVSLFKGVKGSFSPMLSTTPLWLKDPQRLGKTVNGKWKS